MNFKDEIRIIPDFPKAGIRFIDITTLLKNGPVFKEAIKHMVDPFRDLQVDIVVGPEARGFLIGAPVAVELSAGFVPLRKSGKLPAQVARFGYELEYGTDYLEVHADAITPGQKVLIADDLLATGGTTQAAINLVQQLGGEIVGLTFLVELGYLEGRQKLQDYPIFSLMQY